MSRTGAGCARPGRGPEAEEARNESPSMFLTAPAALGAIIASVCIVVYDCPEHEGVILLPGLEDSGSAFLCYVKVVRADLRAQGVL